MTPRGIDYDRLSAEFRELHNADIAGGTWSCSCGKHGKNPTTDLAKIQRGKSRHLRAAQLKFNRERLGRSS